MAWYQDDEVLMNSSSGGAFTTIAEVVLQDNGVVFGATFDEKTWDVYHKPVTCIEELNDIRGSKYYQSQAFLAYADCKKYLDAGIEVSLLRYGLSSGSIEKLSRKIIRQPNHS